MNTLSDTIENNINWNIDVDSLSAHLLQGILAGLNPTVNKVLISITGDGHHLFRVGIQARDISHDLKR